MKVKITIGYCYTHIIIAKIKKMKMQNAGKDTEKLNHSYLDGGHVKWYRHIRGKTGVFFYKEN